MCIEGRDLPIQLTSLLKTMKLSSQIASCFAVTAAVVASGKLSAKAQYVVYQPQPVMVQHRPVLVQRQPVYVHEAINVDHRYSVQVQGGIGVQTGLPGLSFSLDLEPLCREPDVYGLKATDHSARGGQGSAKQS